MPSMVQNWRTFHKKIDIHLFPWTFSPRIRGCNASATFLTSLKLYLSYINHHSLSLVLLAWIYFYETILPATKSIKCMLESGILIWCFCYQWGDAGNAGQGFTPHVIAVAAGEVCIIQGPWTLLVDLDFCIYLQHLVSTVICVHMQT